MFLHAHEGPELLTLGLLKDKSPIHHTADAVVNRRLFRRILPRRQPPLAAHAATPPISILITAPMSLPTPSTLPK
jgi:hypothetical protein